MATDRELIDQIRHGEREAYGQLFQKYYAQIYAICFAMLKNPQDAEELAQDVFVFAYLRLDQLREPDSFLPWLKKITRNRSKNRVRRSGPRLVPLNLARSHTTTNTPDEQVLRRELMDAIMEAIESLPARDREVVRARIDGLTHTEISERFGISVEASMSRLYRSRRRLADSMKDLRSVIFGLPKMLNLKKLISGGTIAMKIGTGAKVTIGIIGILAAGTIGFLISTYQLEPTKADKGQIAATTEQGGADAPGKASDASAGEHSKEQGVMDKDEEEGWNALMEVIDEVAETPDTKTAAPQSRTAQSGTPQTTSFGTEDSEASQDKPKMEYHESYRTFVSITKKVKETKEERDRIRKEMDWLVAEWKRSVRDPENPTEEENAELGEEVTPLRIEYGKLDSDLNSLANEIVSEIEAVAPDAIQTKSEDMPRGDVVFIVDSVSVDYDQVQSELGSAGESIDGYLSDFFAGFAMKSIPSVGRSWIDISE